MRRQLLAPGVRTVPARDWGSGIATAATVTVADPALWLLGLVSFAVRGGVVVLALPMLTLPSPVLLSILFRDQVGEVGRGDALPIAIGVGVVLAIAAIAGIVIAAWAEVAAVERVLRDPETAELRLGRSPRALTPGARRALVWWVASIGCVALVPIIGAASLVVDRIATLVTRELVHPSATDLPLAMRVGGEALPQLAAALAVVVLAEVGASLASRRLLVAAYGLLPHDPSTEPGTRIALEGLRRAVREPARVLGTAAVGWIALVGGAAFAMLVAGGAFEVARDALLAGDPEWDPGSLAVAAGSVALLVAAWLAGLVTAGLVAAFRSALWTVDALR